MPSAPNSWIAAYRLSNAALRDLAERPGLAFVVFLVALLPGLLLSAGLEGLALASETAGLPGEEGFDLSGLNYLLWSWASSGFVILALGAVSFLASVWASVIYWRSQNRGLQLRVPLGALLYIALLVFVPVALASGLSFLTYSASEVFLPELGFIAFFFEAFAIWMLLRLSLALVLAARGEKASIAVSLAAARQQPARFYIYIAVNFAVFGTILSGIGYAAADGIYALGENGATSRAYFWSTQLSIFIETSISAILLLIEAALIWQVAKGESDPA